MVRNRTFLIGLGAGIVIGALLLQLMLIGQQSLDPIEAGDAGVKTYTQEEVDAMLADSLKAAESDKQAGDPSNPSAEPEPTPEPSSASASPEAPSQAADSAEAAAPDWKIVRVEPGMGLYEAGELLQAEGLIEDTAAFVKQMKGGGKLARAGYFLFAGEPTLEEITEIVSSTPLSSAQLGLLKKQLDGTKEAKLE